ncbi:COG3313 Predicted Fe-S protein [Rhabdaerophilaceae bacterium]
MDDSSPCVKVCILDPATGFCLGCARTGSEIASWSRMTAEERVALKRSLAPRLSLLARLGGRCTVNQKRN